MLAERPNPSKARLRASLAGRLAGMALLAVVAQGCAEKPPPPPPEPPAPPPPHAGPPPAAFCSVAPFTVKTGGSADVRMIVSHEGGYCAATLVADSGQPYDAPLVPVPSLHGIPRVVRYAGKTSVEYAPQPGFVGHDNFVAQLIVRGQPGYTTLNVSVTVQ